MNLDSIFENANSKKIWQNYFKRVEKITQVLDGESRKETMLELQDHLYQSYLEQKGTDEVSRLLNAIEGLGDPDDYLKAVVSEKLLQSGTRTLSPKKLVKGLILKMSFGFSSMLLAIFFGTGYLVTFIMALLPFFKFIIPEKVGLFIWEDSSWNFGIVKNTAGSVEILGFWIVPIGLIVAFIFYFILTQLLKVTLKR